MVVNKPSCRSQIRRRYTPPVHKSNTYWLPELDKICLLNKAFSRSLLHEKRIRNRIISILVYFHLPTLKNDEIKFLSVTIPSKITNTELTRILSGLISACKMLHFFNNFNAKNNCWLYDRTAFTWSPTSLPYFFNTWKKNIGVVKVTNFNSIRFTREYVLRVNSYSRARTPSTNVAYGRNYGITLNNGIYHQDRLH